MISRRLTITAVAAVAALSVTACGGGSDGAANNANSVRVGIKFDQPGLGLKVGNEYKGFDVDVANYIANKMGKTPVFSEAPSPQRETLIKTGQVDFIVATYSISDARKKEVTFSGPYIVVGQDLLVRAEDNSITGPDKLDGKKLCSVKGSTSAQKIKDSYPKVQLQEYDTYSKCVEEVVAGTVDALSTDDAILAGYAAQDQYKGKLRLVGKPFTVEKLGIGMKKGDVEMCQTITTAVQEMIKNGEWQKSIDTNLGPSGYKVNSKYNPPTFDPCV